MYAKLQVVAIVLLLYIVPLLIFLLGQISFADRFTLLVGITALVLILVKIEGIKPESLGLTQHNLKSATWNILPFTIGFSILMLCNYWIQGARLNNTSIQWSFYLFFILISVPAQEFLYRGYLFHIFNRIKIPPVVQVVASALLYSFAHAIYWDIPTLLLTFVGGLYWGYHYAQYRNLYSLILSHALLGIVAIATGLL